MIRDFLKNAFLLSATEVILNLKGLIMLPLLTKTFGAIDYGIWYQVSVIVSMIVPLVIMGTDQSLIRYVSGKDQVYAKKAISTELTYVIILSLLFGIVLYAVSHPLAGAFFNGDANYQFVAICGYIILTTSVMSVLRQWYRVRNSVKTYSAINITQSFSNMFLAIAIVILHGSILELVLVMASADAILAIILISHIILTQGLAKPDPSLLMKFLKYGIPVMPAAYAMWVFNGSDRLMIGYFGTLTDIGIYSVAYGIGYFAISAIFGPIWMMYPVKATELYEKGEVSQINVLFNYSMKAALGLIIPALFGLIVLATPLLLLLSTSDFISGAYLIPLIVIGYSFHMIGYFYNVSLGLVFKQKYEAYIMVFAATLNLVLNLMLIPAIGIYGAAIATIIGFGVQMILQVYIANRYLPLTFDWAFVVKSFISSALMGAIIYVINPSGIAYVISSIIMGVIIYAFAMLMLRAISREDVNSIMDVIGVNRVKNSSYVKMLKVKILR